MITVEMNSFAKLLLSLMLSVVCTRYETCDHDLGWDFIIKTQKFKVFVTVCASYLHNTRRQTLKIILLVIYYVCSTIELARTMVGKHWYVLATSSMN